MTLATSREVAEHAEAVFTMVTDDSALRRSRASLRALAGSAGGI
jgi:3-hydroxyisobutyrate dehydrogenase-like beta-hydroxyacid dehydrogenase